MPVVRWLLAKITRSAIHQARNIKPISREISPVPHDKIPSIAEQRKRQILVKISSHYAMYTLIIIIIKNHKIIKDDQD